MSDIKAVIQLLCQHLNILLDINLKAENFRLAKFNHDDTETIQLFWTALEKLCFALGPRIHEHQMFNPYTWVKLEMVSRNYMCTEFYCVPIDGCSGSRELLLALMWLIAKENVLAFLTQENVRQSPLCHEYSDVPKKSVESASNGFAVLNSEIKKDLGLEDQMNYALLLANRIKHNLNQILDLEEERIKNTHLVHKATAGSSGLPHLSVFETSLVREPDLLKEWMPRLSRMNDLLNIHTKWLKKRSAFWEWMNSVVELKAKEFSENRSTQLKPESENALADFSKALHKCTVGTEKSQDTKVTTSLPRFFISSLYAKSTSNLIRKASSSDLLADIGLNESGIIVHASDWLAQIESELQTVEELKHGKLQELNAMLQSMTQKLGLVAISDVSNGEVESEECSK